MKQNPLFIAVVAPLAFVSCTEPNPASSGPCDSGLCAGAEMSTTSAGHETDHGGAPTGPRASSTGDTEMSGDGPDGSLDATTTGEQPPASCGDGQVDEDEVCDHGADNGAYGHCDRNCAGLGPRCGDGELNGLEICDDGPDNGDYGRCAEDCSAVAAHCGDGQLDPARETCDDGNTRSNDGCDRDCVPSAVVDIESGYLHNCVRLRLGDVKCWGDGGGGRLGTDSTENFGDEVGETPANLATLDLGGPVAQLALGVAHSCALMVNGRVKCWGEGEDGGLGYGDVADIGTETRPLNSVGFVDVDSRGRLVRQLRAGANHTCALVDGGAVRCWGRNDMGQLGRDNNNVVSTTAPSTSPDIMFGVTAVGLATGANTSCIRTQTGGLRCWGDNSYGQLGNALSGITEHVGDGPGEIARLTDITLPSGDQLRVAAVSVMGYHACASEGSTIRCWGAAANGRLGAPDLAGVEVQAQPVTATVLAGMGTIVQLSLGRYHSCARDTAGHVTCWGHNQAGQLGTGDRMDLGVEVTDRAQPLAIDPDATVQDISTGMAHTCVLLSSGAVRCWGHNTSGQLGYGGVAPELDATTVGDVQIF